LGYYNKRERIERKDKMPSKKLTMDDEEQVREDFADGVTIKELMGKYHIGESTARITVAGVERRIDPHSKNRKRV
jgi:hypothetical protein